jgi:putative lipoic acid-binding regulatory protein
MRTFDDRKPEITYPCAWSYRVIGADEVRLRAVILEVIGDVDHSLRLANESSQGRYRSLHLEVVVRDEEHRNSIFSALGKHPDVRFVF